MDKNCLFCKFASGTIVPKIVYEDDLCIVIMDKFPLTRGQSLVIGKAHTDYVFDLDDKIYTHCMLVAKRVVKATDKALNSERCWLFVQGLEVAHNHIKILPMYSDKHILLEEGTGKEVNDEELEELAQMIKSELEK
ncbi:MAG: HIT family protein [Candidatus Diapherotrites archaeon]|jgi:histidine triad (HIT) family protein|uniref:HIT family protein n=1 Tax=Candidatus Iainarchaeum sp. TaxID=3101447 RepID=A0A8T5GDN1_9ARCH|nr:HIT family protein [Candidatus Diapherotrites archaeon]MBT7240927.1 HIT family protein [Candidatus Diapherotrites archaeon]